MLNANIAQILFRKIKKLANSAVKKIHEPIRHFSK
jgi:hypothetical protein